MLAIGGLHDDLPGSRHEVESILRIVEQGTSADRQLAIFKQTNDLKDVVDNLIAETMEGVPPTTDYRPPTTDH